MVFGLGRILDDRYRLVKHFGVIVVLIPFFWIDLARTNSISLTPICRIQGSYFTSPYQGDTVRTHGVVFADLDQTYQKGFFMQAENCDGRSTTSDGIYVYLGEKVDVVNSGDLVELTGTVQEYYGMTEIQVAPGDVTVISSGNPLPDGEDLDPPFQNSEARWYFEAREGMYVRLDLGRVVGPTDNDDRTWLVRDDLGIGRVFYDDSRGTGEVICVEDNGLFAITPEARVGDRVQGFAGALEYRFGDYCMVLVVSPTLIPQQTSNALIQGRSPFGTGVFSFRVATFNLADLFDTIDDPTTDDTKLTGTEYLRRLEKRALAIHEILDEPAFIAVQEAENVTVLLDLVARPEIQADYGVVLQDGPDRRGMDVALLYRRDQVQIIDYQARQGCTTLIDGLEPDGNGDVENPQSEITCDTDNDGTLDGNRLFSRPPLVVRAWVCRSGCPGTFQGEPIYQGPFKIWLVVNHWKSKVEDTSTVQYTLPRRIEQAKYVAGLVQEILGVDSGANLIVLGDLNDHPNSQPLNSLASQGLQDLSPRVAKPGRYTYIYEGVSQILDYVLVCLQPSLFPGTVNPLHINTDFPYMYMNVADSFHRSSDHDLLQVDFIAMDYLRNFPLVFR